MIVPPGNRTKHSAEISFSWSSFPTRYSPSGSLSTWVSRLKQSPFSPSLSVFMSSALGKLRNIAQWPIGSGPAGCLKPLPSKTTKLPPATLPDEGWTQETCSSPVRCCLALANVNRWWIIYVPGFRSPPSPPMVMVPPSPCGVVWGGLVLDWVGEC